MRLVVEVDDETKNELLDEFKKLYFQTIEQARLDVVALKEVLTIEEACTLLDVSRNTLKSNFISRGLPEYKVGNRVYINKNELHQFIRRHQI